MKVVDCESEFQVMNAQVRTPRQTFQEWQEIKFTYRVPFVISLYARVFWSVSPFSQNETGGIFFRELKDFYILYEFAYNVAQCSITVDFPKISITKSPILPL